jgi:hypothetical protein
MTQDARERGLIMIEHVQLKEDPYLIGMIGAPTNDPDEIRVGPSDHELIEIDEIVGLDNPEVTTPQARSPGDVSDQPETVRT